MQIESCRIRLEEFEQNLNRELYSYYAGRKNRLEILPIYSNYSDLFSAESIREVEAELKKTGESFGSRRKSLDKIIGFMIDQHLDVRAAPLTQESIAFEAIQTLRWEGRDIALSQVPACLREESDAYKRRKLNERRAQALAESGLKQRIVAQLHSAAAGLGFRNCLEARERITGNDYSRLLNSFDAALSPLSDRYLEQLRLSFETVLGLPIQEAGSWDVACWRKKYDREHVFPERDLIPVVKATVSELGIQPERDSAVTIDTERRERMQRGSLCIPISIPHEIKIVMTQGSGAGSYAALLHESGHAHHFAWTSPSLPAEHRIWGDRALSESYAFLLENFFLDPQWLAHMLSFTESQDFLRFQSLYRMFLVRRSVGRLRFALRLHEGESLENMPQVYAEIMEAATGLRHQPESWIEVLPDGFESADYLRGWALESILREYLCSKYGKAWAQNRSSSGFLKEIWETGQLYRADELCREIGIGDLDPQVLADHLSEGLQK